MTGWWHVPVGVVGTALILIAYFLIQTGRIRAINPWYSIMNAVGSFMILVSLYFDFNLAAALVEGFWLLISFVGLWRSLRARMQLP